MPLPGKRWFHITFGTHGAWLPGDPRGFRAKGHRLHSSGDHRHPPPAGEHHQLHTYSERLASDAVRLPQHLLPVIGQAILSQAEQQNHRINAISVAPMHVHLLTELRRDGTAAEIGRIKRRASWAVRHELPGRVWAKGCGIKPVRDKAHMVNTYRYILTHAGQGAWVWSIQDGIR
jgi:REP element-mobilizing transposase RayT